MLFLGSIILLPLNGPVKVSPYKTGRHFTGVRKSCNECPTISSCHASRGRASPRRLPERTRARILELARGNREL
jgi:hypothetical protein